MFTGLNKLLENGILSVTEAVVNFVVVIVVYISEKGFYVGMACGLWQITLFLHYREDLYKKSIGLSGVETERNSERF